jgi:hypothetical protein
VNGIISNAFGTTGFGKLNNFIFPFPVTLTIKSRLSPFFRLVLWGHFEFKTPTAPENQVAFLTQEVLLH